MAGARGTASDRRYAAGSRSRRGGPTDSEEDSTTLELALRLGIPAGETAWLEHALTHRSYTREQGHESRESNERLEFLGDAVAQLAVSQLLYERYPRWSEGELTRARSAVVSREPMLRAASRLGLGKYMKLGKTEDELGGRERPSILSACFEAVVAAVYLTSGMDAAHRFIQSALEEELDSIQSAGSRTDYKTALQEACQMRLHVTPTYRLSDMSGPAHARSFAAEALVNGEVYGRGEGRTKKEAEQAAAQAALSALERLNPLDTLKTAGLASAEIAPLGAARHNGEESLPSAGPAQKVES